MILRAEHPFYSKRAEQPRSKKVSKTGAGSTSIEKNRENVSFKGKFDQKLVEQPPFQGNAACKRNMCAVNR